MTNVPASSPRRSRLPRWGYWLLAVVVLLLVAGLVLRALLPDDATLARRLAEGFEQRTGIALRIGRLHWALRPVPVLELGDVATDQDPPVRIGRIVVTLALGDLLARRVAVDELRVEDATLPRASVQAFRGRVQSNASPGAIEIAGLTFTRADVPLRRLTLRSLTWIDRRDIALAYDAKVDFAPGWRPRTAEISRPGVTPEAVARLERQADEDRWQVRIRVADGSWDGEAALQAPSDGPVRLVAELEPRRIDLAALTRTFGRHHSIEGRFDGRTRIEAEAAEPAELLHSLHTATRFTMRPATVVGFDLAKAVTTAGRDRSGGTRFDELTGVVETQARSDGIVLRYSDLRARSGVLSASGSATVFNRRIDGEFAIDIVDGMVGVPFRVTGTLERPVLSMTGGAAAGAAVGSAVLPGIGTAIGARIGQKLEKWFGSDSEPAGTPAPRR